jgi:hypothetical protein
MISIIPPLDFMRSLCGAYKASTGQAELRIWSCGYGVALDLRGEKKTELVGVVGAFNSVVECYAQVGLPNIVRFVGQKTAGSAIHFIADDLPLSMDLTREPGLVRIIMSLHGQKKVSHELRAA